MSSSSPVTAFNREEPIPGYFTKELIGTGGFGEVWKAHAPGGLVKAIKIVYGRHDARRASRELRSLNRIKQARHPFLLSIERIEIVDDNLVIVTELADGNLKQRFDELTERGHRGIPRQDLLSFLSDAADGLDYIYSQFSLQHLDVKPENLLLIGDRVKVADFGLAKNIYDRSASLVEGLTPTYAPPEVFDGRPHRNSDQYSLAIVYQELLTGQLPFGGTTAAQLASQHLHSAPSLSSLSKGEQPILARALSKDPDARYPNCRALIDQLLKVSLEPEHEESAQGKVELGGAGGRTAAAASGERATLRIVPHVVLPHYDAAPHEPLADRAELSPIQIDPTAVVYYPTIFVGVGGLATRVLRKLRRRLCDRFGALSSVPTIGMLALDTDVKSLNAAMQSSCGDPLAENETLALPLRSPQDYRSRADRILGWLSRRWLYNIPKSLQTDGLRPLGRLALVDHASRVRARLAQLIDDVTSEDSLQTARNATGLNFTAAAPRIYLVASVSGASGGGMFLDLAYLLRTLLVERELSDDEVHGLLLTASTRVPQERERATASAYAALGELWHYSKPGNCYPGEPACGVPPFHGNNRTFGSCYLLPLGQNLNEGELEAAIDPVAEYLYCSSATPGSAFFDQARRPDQLADQLTLRTFGLCQLGGSNSGLPGAMAETLCHQVVMRWRSGEEPSGPQATLSLTRPTELLAAHNKVDSRYRQVERLAMERATTLGLGLERMDRQVRDMLLQEMGKETDAYFAAVIREALRNGAPGDAAQRTEQRLKHVLQVVDLLLAEASHALDSGRQAQFDSLYEVLLTRVEARSAELGNAVRDWLFALIENPDLRVEGAIRAGEWFQRHLRDLEGRTSSLATQIKEGVFAAKESLLASGRSEAAGNARENRNDASSERLTELEARVLEYAQLRVEEVVHRAVSKWLRLSDAHVTQAVDRLQELWRDLNHFAGQFAEGQFSHSAGCDGPAPQVVQEHWRLLRNDLERKRAELAAQLDRVAEEQLLRPLGGLRHFLSKSTDLGKELFAPLQFGARMLTIRHMRSMSGKWLLDKSAGQADLDLNQLRRWTDAATPALSGQNGRCRLLLILAKQLQSLDIEAKLPTATDRTASVVYAQESDLIVCCEEESIPFAPLMASFIGNNPQCAEIAKRLHTRIDVDWQPVTSGGRASSGV